jgi:hypothetical protein
MLRNIFLVVLTLAMLAFAWTVVISKPSNKHVCEEVYCRLALGMLESDLPTLLGAPSSVVTGEPRRLRTAEGDRIILFDTLQGAYRVNLYTNDDEQIAVAVSGGRVLATEYRVSLHSVFYLGPKTLTPVGGVGTVASRPPRADAITQRIVILFGNTPPASVKSDQTVIPPPPGEDTAREKILELGTARQSVVDDLAKQTSRTFPDDGSQLAWFSKWLSQILEFECYAMADDATAASVVEKCKAVGLPNSYSESWTHFFATKAAARQAIANRNSPELQDEVKQLCSWREARDSYRQNIANMREQVTGEIRALLQCDNELRFANFAKLDLNTQERLLKLCVKAKGEQLDDADYRLLSGYAGISPALDAAAESHKATAIAASPAEMPPAPDSEAKSRRAMTRGAGFSSSDRKHKPIRLWTSTGGHTVSARFVSKFGDRVKLQREDDTVITVDASQLSDTDNEYLKSLER